MTDGMNLKRMVDGLRIPDNWPEPEDPRIPKLLARIAYLEGQIAKRDAKDILDLDMFAPIAEIADYVSDKTRISVKDIRSDRRHAPLSKARAIVMYLACQHTKLSTLQIGKFLRKDHTSVMYGRDRIKKLLDQEPYLKSLVEGFGASQVPQEL